MHHIFSNRRLLAGLMCSVALPSTVIAQNQNDDIVLLEEIEVTAERRSSSLQDVPLSITALGGDEIASARIQNTQDLVNLTPGLIVQRSVIGKISIRGIGNENFTISGDPGVALHSDGIYVARASAGLFDLFDIDRVEVVRGPQGTLYGRNATGGVINFVPATPDEEFGGYARAEYGNFDHVRLEGALNVPLVEDKLLFRAAGLGAWRDGFTENIFPGAEERGLDELDNKDFFAFRGQLEYRGSERFNARFAVEYLNDDSNLQPYKYLNQPSALPDENYLLGQLRTVSQGYELDIPGSGRTVGNDDDIFKTNQLGLALHLDYEADSFVVKSISGYRETDFNWLNDGDGADIFQVNYIQQDQSKQYSQELQFASNSDGRFDWIVGGFAFRETGDSFIALPFPFGADLPFFILIDGEAETTAYAGFAEAGYQLNDKLKFTAGLRYSWEEREARYRYEVNFGAPVVVSPDERDSFDAFTPRFVIDYAATDDVNFYASATRGFKSGGFNLLAIQPGFDPEKVWSYEAGVKSLLADGRVRLNANAFYMDYKNLQVGQVVNLSAILTNAAEATIWGFEGELEVQATEAFNMGATIAYLNAEYDDFCTGDPTQPDAAIAPGCDAANPLQLAGNTLPRSPEWAITIDGTYTFDLGSNGRVDLRGDARYQSEVFFTQFNRPEIRESGYIVANAQLTWTDAQDKYSVGLWAANIFDETYFSEVLESGAFNPELVAQAYVAPPRTYGIRAGVKF